jgi:transcriptional regulator
MYTPRHFSESDLTALDALFERDAFVTLISSVDGAPFATHLPVLYRRDDDRIHIQGHWARPNPQWRHISEQSALMIVHGPHAYISPSWYANPAVQVPTWNYATAHLYGEISVFEDAPTLQTLVAALAERYERSLASDWRFPDSAMSQLGALAGIVGFRLDVQRVELKLKLNQNHPDANVRGAIQGLMARGDDNAVAIADLMQQRLDRRNERED